MTLLEKIKFNLKSIIENEFLVEEYEFIPTHNNQAIQDLNKGKKFKAAVLYIDMRGSTKILSNHNKSTVAKLHKAYYEVIIPIVSSQNGKIRSYNGDSLLAFFKGTPQKAIGNAVKAAMQIKFAFSHAEHGVNKILKKYTKLDFGVGIDYGEILCTMIGTNFRDKKYSSDLIWIGKPVNKSVRLGDKAEFPYSIRISEFVYKNLPERWLYTYGKNIFNFKIKVDKWEKDEFRYTNQRFLCYKSKFDYPLK